MTLPRDWSKKKDWLDQAKEPSHLGGKGYAQLWLAGFLILLTAGALGLGAWRLFF